MADPILVADGIGHAYRAGSWQFRSLSFALERGASLAILGPNGRGKSTLLSVLAGTRRPTEGSVSRVADVALVPSGLATDFDYTVLDMVVMGRAKRVPLLAGPSVDDEDAALTALARFGIETYANRSYATLSSGERQLVLLARAIASEAAILLFDEPTSSLDLRHQADVAGWIERLRRDGFAVVFTTHDPNLAALANDVLMMFNAPAAAFGRASDLIQAKSLSELFGCRVAAARDGETGRTVFSAIPQG